MIAGGRLRGTMYGVYTLLEKRGCRWFTAEVSRIPKLPVLRLHPIDELQRPAFEYREPFFTEAFDADWAARNKVNGKAMRLDERRGGKVAYYPFVHTLYRLIPPETCFAAHPESFSLIDGKRRHQRGQLCLSNPEVVKLGTRRLLGWIEEHPEATIYSVPQNDWENWCECERCRQIEQEEGGRPLRACAALRQRAGRRGRKATPRHADRHAGLLVHRDAPGEGASAAERARADCASSEPAKPTPMNNAR